MMIGVKMITLEVGDIIEITVNCCGVPYSKGSRAEIVGKGKENEYYARLFADSFPFSGASSLITVRTDSSFDWFKKIEGKIEK